ncbi:hypothetical protein IAY_06823, partial [Bacillus cereus TIAC219]
NQIVTNAIKYSNQEDSKIKIYTTHNENNIVLGVTISLRENCTFRHNLDTF